MRHAVSERPLAAPGNDARQRRPAASSNATGGWPTIEISRAELEQEGAKEGLSWLLQVGRTWATSLEWTHRKGQGAPGGVRACREVSRRRYRHTKASYIESRPPVRFCDGGLRLGLCAFLRGHPRVQCGEGDPVVLEFNHRDPALKAANISEILRSGTCANRRSATVSWGLFEMSGLRGLWDRRSARATVHLPAEARVKDIGWMISSVNGHWDLNAGGQQNCTLAVTRSARSRSPNLHGSRGWCLLLHLLRA
jgi:hypothetical protein